MIIFSWHLIRSVLLQVAWLLLVFTTPALADKDVKVPFLFNEDEALVQSVLKNVVPRSSALSADPYLNAPFTRLDYLLMMLEAALNKEGNRLNVLQEVEDGFEPMEGFMGKRSADITGLARYELANGRIAIMYSVENVGRPLRPMRETCDKILSSLEYIAPKKQLGYLYHNTVLGILAQTDFAEYTPALNTLAKSIVHGVRLKSQTEKMKVNHFLTCLRSGKDTPVHYSRMSFKLKGSRQK